MKSVKEWIALLLAVVMTFCLPSAVSAETGSTDEGQSAVESETVLDGTEMDSTEDTADGQDEAASVSEETEMETETEAETETESDDLYEDEANTYAGCTMENQSSSSQGARRAAARSAAAATPRSDDYVQHSGIDVWAGQGIIDWTKVADDGCDFAIVKVAGRYYRSGGLYEDSYYATNIEEASAAGLKVGVYFFSSAITEQEAVEEADYICDRISGYNIDLPVFMDYEYESGYSWRMDNGASQAERTAIIRAFCNEVEARGYTPGVYANASTLQYRIYGSELAEDYALWAANYNSYVSIYSGVYDYWQYSSTGTVSGISGNVDMDYWYETEKDTVEPITGTQTIDDGIYTIHCKADLSRVLDIAGGSAADSANLQLYYSNCTNAQKYQVSYNGDGTYTLTCLNSGKAIDVSGGSTKTGTNIAQYTANGTGAQKWVIEDAGGGYYKIRSSLSGKVLGCAGGKTGNGVNIELRGNSSSDTNLFRFSPIPEETALEEGEYSITTALDSGCSLDVCYGSRSNCANIGIYSVNGTVSQLFDLTRNSDGTYTITAAVSHKVLDVKNGNAADGTNVQQYVSNQTSAQKWYIIQNGDGTYTVYSALSGSVLDVAGGKTANLTNVQEYSPNNTAAQKWYFTATGNPAETDLSGTYYILCAGNQNLALDITDGSKQAGANLWIYSLNRSKAQQFKLERTAAYTYIIRNVNSGRVLDVKYGSTKDGANVWQYTQNGTDAQKWIVYTNSDGTYTFADLNSDKVLDITSGRIKSRTNIQQYYDNKTISQKFVLKN